VVPLEEGVIEPEFDPVVSLEGAGQLAHDVSLWSHILKHVLADCASKRLYLSVEPLENIAKCRHLKKLPCKGTLWQVRICQSPGTPTPFLHCIRVYSMLIHTGKGRELIQREG
jgi:hypothetical protein